MGWSLIYTHVREKKLSHVPQPTASKYHKRKPNLDHASKHEHVHAAAPQLTGAGYRTEPFSRAKEAVVGSRWWLRLTPL